LAWVSSAVIDRGRQFTPRNSAAAIDLLAAAFLANWKQSVRRAATAEASPRGIFNAPDWAPQRRRRALRGWRTW
jgi:hypothetical protein